MDGLTSATGVILFSQTGAGAVTFGVGSVVHRGRRREPDQRHLNITIQSDVTAGGAGATATIDAGTAAIIAGAGRVTAENVVLRSANGIGSAAAPLLLDTAFVDATNSAAGEVGLANLHSTATRVEQIVNGSGAGGITFTQAGGGPATFNNVTTTNAANTNGTITITVSGADLIVRAR